MKIIFLNPWNIFYFSFGENAKLLTIPSFPFWFVALSVHLEEELTKFGVAKLSVILVSFFEYFFLKLVILESQLISIFFLTL